MRKFEERAGLAAQAAITAAVLFGAAVILLLPQPARGHQAKPVAGTPLWNYGVECCSNKDCREASNDEVGETPQGYLIRASNTLIPYNDRRVKQSGDEFFHICTVGGKPDGRVLCVYVPPRSF